MTRSVDCVVCGSCVVDLIVRPVPLGVPIGAGRLLRTEPITASVGGIVSNAGIAMARLGMRVAALSMVGADPWASVVRDRYLAEGIDTGALETHPSEPTSTTAVLVDERGERTFAHHHGAPRALDPAFFERHRARFRDARMMLFGYFPLLGSLRGGFEDVLRMVRDAGCAVAVDASGDGGTLDELAPLLPLIDVYVPSRSEAMGQTGESDPERMIAAYRACGAVGFVGVKLGEEGAVLSPTPGDVFAVEATKPPGPVVDTTGAGDAFFAGLIAGLLGELSPRVAGRLAAAAGALCVTARGATDGLGNWTATAALAGLGADADRDLC